MASKARVCAKLFDDLPDELLSRVLLLGGPAVAATSATLSRRFRKLAEDEALWLELSKHKDYQHALTCIRGTPNPPVDKAREWVREVFRAEHWLGGSGKGRKGRIAPCSVLPEVARPRRRRPYFIQGLAFSGDRYLVILRSLKPSYNNPSQTTYETRCIIWDVHTSQEYLSLVLPNCLSATAIVAADRDAAYIWYTRSDYATALDDSPIFNAVHIGSKQVTTTQISDMDKVQCARNGMVVVWCFAESFESGELRIVSLKNQHVITTFVPPDAANHNSLDDAFIGDSHVSIITAQVLSDGSHCRRVFSYDIKSGVWAHEVCSPTALRHVAKLVSPTMGSSWEGHFFRITESFSRVIRIPEWDESDFQTRTQGGMFARWAEDGDIIEFGNILSHIEVRFCARLHRIDLVAIQADSTDVTAPYASEITDVAISVSGLVAIAREDHVLVYRL